MLISVGEVNDQSNDEPDGKSEPIMDMNLSHQIQAS